MELDAACAEIAGARLLLALVADVPEQAGEQRGVQVFVRCGQLVQTPALLLPRIDLGATLICIKVTLLESSIFSCYEVDEVSRHVLAGRSNAVVGNAGHVPRAHSRRAGRRSRDVNGAYDRGGASVSYRQ